MVRNFLKYLSNLPAWRTKRKLIIFLSDDWGGMRIPSLEERANLIRAGINMDGNRFNRFDCLENNRDMEALFEVLLKHKNANGQSPILTAVSNVASPDFDRIKESNFEQYFYKNTLECLAENIGSDRVHQLYQEGIRHKIYQPEFHGREHVDFNYWLKILKTGNKKVIEAFNNRFFFVDPEVVNKDSNRAFDGAYNLSGLNELESHVSKTKDGLDIFEKIYGYRASCFTPPSTYYHSRLNSTLREDGIKIIDIPKLRKEPIGRGKYKKKFHYAGQKSKEKEQFYLVRNAVFEPNQNEKADGVEGCIVAIETAFSHSQPAIISNHRAAFVGGIDEKNRKEGLKALDQLLQKIFLKWSDAEFITPKQLGQLMSEKNKVEHQV